MRMMKWMRLAGMALMSVAAVSLLPGCDGGGDGDGGGGSSIVGTWQMYEGATAEGQPATWWHFNSDGTWYSSDSVDGNPHVSGSYTLSGNRFEGPLTNPRVGTGKIEGTIEGGRMTADFIEYWHSPAKHVPFVGVKLD